jgi:hypothetical protein
MKPIYELRFFFDYGSGVCLWAGNDAAREAYDYPVSAEWLPLGDDLLARVDRLLEEYDSSLDWDNPGGPSLWSEQQWQVFYAEARQLLAALRQQLGSRYEVRDELELFC